MGMLKAAIRTIAAGMLFLAFNASAQQLLYGVNPFQNDATSLPASAGLFRLNSSTGAILSGTVITMPPRTINGAQGLARDPTTGTVYAIVRAVAVAGRLLATINVNTGVATEIGNLGDNFSSIAFRADGQLFGVTGDGAAVPETLYLINKATAATVVATALGNGADGEVIAYNPDDNSFYHWSGNGLIVFERISAVAPYTVTNIPITGSTSGEVFGAVWDPDRSRFLVHNISSSMDFWTTTGVRSNAQPATLTDVRGMVLFPAAGIPTLSQWALIALSLLLVAVAFLLGRRRGGTGMA